MWPDLRFPAFVHLFWSEFLQTFIDLFLVIVWHIRHVLMSDDGETEALPNEVKYGKLRYL